MNNNEPITFLLSDRPTHYLACVEGPARFDCTHIAIKLAPFTLIRLVWMRWIASLLRLVGIKIVVFEAKVGALEVAGLQYIDQHFLGANDETSGDETPYDCLSLGELASLGGYATNAVLDAHFTTLSKEAKMYAIDVHAERFSMRLNIHYLGSILSIETNPFNVDILVKDFLARNILRTGRNMTEKQQVVCQ